VPVVLILGVIIVATRIVVVVVVAYSLARMADDIIEVLEFSYENSCIGHSVRVRWLDRFTVMVYRECLYLT
jgi:hypothetical protein